MNRKLVLGVLSGLAAIGLAVGGTTYAAFSDFGEIDNNLVAAGFLQLNVDVGGSSDAALGFGQTMPGQSSSRFVWLSSQDGSSVPDANVGLTFHNLVDVPAPCDTSRDKAVDEDALGIDGCTVDGDTVTGTPAQGNLSRVLSLQVSYYPAVGDASACAAVQDTEPHQAVLAESRGNLFTSASADDGAGTRLQVFEADGTTPVVVGPGAGVCLGIAADWPQDSAPTDPPSADHPTDNAAQGDSLSVDVRFDLDQVT